LRESGPNRPEGYAIEALVHSRSRRADEAIRVLQQGLVKAPSSELALMLYGSLVSRGSEPEASRVARDWLQRHPTDSRMRYEVAIRDLVGGKPGQAEAGLRQVVEANPRNVLALHALAHVLTGLGQRDALGFAERAASLAPEDVAVLDTLASAQAAAGRQAEALETQRRAVAMAPDDMVLRLGLARIALQGGDKATAREEIERLRKLGTAFPNQSEVESLAQKL
jgi:cellulose synthase operon protein C